MYKAGKQIDGQTLYERQQESIKLQRNVVAPVIIATGLRTPDNIASVLRIADAAYSNRIVFVTDENDTVEFNNKIKRLSRSTDKGIRIEQYELDTFLNICGDLPVMIALEITTLSENVFETKLPDNCSLVIGSEGRGISNQVLDKCQRAVHIPMYGKNGSMNVSHALAIGLFEWRRQRQ